MLFTLGFLITIALCVPLALVNLDDNINVQVVAFAISWIIALQWIV